MQIHFTATESVAMTVEEQEVPVQHYLRQPQRLVRAIAEPTLMEQLDQEYFRLKMRPLNFMDLYHFQPTVVLRVWTGASGAVYLKSHGCEIRGIEYINTRFSLNLKGKLSPVVSEEKTNLVGKADLEVNVELPPPLWLTPKPLLEVAGNGLLKGVLSRIKQKITTQLLNDYRHWALNDSELVRVSGEQLSII
jgi:hypothetical protein